jgi:GT2 family glycosyltransferase
MDHSPRVGILILNYHHPEETLACVRRLLEVEGPWTRILWIENDAARTERQAREVLEASEIPWISLNSDADHLPPEGCIGFLPVEENLGYAGGNNVGLRFLHRLGVEFTWIMNNDTYLTRGSSAELLKAAEAAPEVGLWGMVITSEDSSAFLGGLVQSRDFAVAPCLDRSRIETDPMAFISGCAMFFRTELGVSAGCIPEEYFLYYEDLAFTWELRTRGARISAVDTVEVLHAESAATGRRSPTVEYYTRRNRWRFIQRYFPDRLRGQILRFFTYQMQKLCFRLRFDRVRLEWRAYRDFREGRMGRVQN